MAVGDGIRRSLPTVSKEERDMSLDAIQQFNALYYPGARGYFLAGRECPIFCLSEPLGH